MKSKLAVQLGMVIIIVEMASISALLFLLGQEGLPAKIDVVLVFLLPITFGFHVFEEFTFPGGGTDWFKAYHPEYIEAFTDPYFFKINAIPLVLSVLVSLGVFNYVGSFSFWGIRAWLAFLSMQGFNVIFHIRGAIRLRTKQPSPGMVTAILLYSPLVIISYVHLLQTGIVDVFSAIVCLAIGSLLQPTLDAIKDRSLKAGG